MAYFKALYAFPLTDIRNISTNCDQNTNWSQFNMIHPVLYNIIGLPEISELYHANASLKPYSYAIVQRDGLWYFK